MRHGLIPKLIVFQASLPFLDGEASGPGKGPLVAFPEADTAVAFHDCREFWNLDTEFEGPAVAVAFVGLEFWGGG